jgi:L-ascorbate metabolism protein UlaG (beta-lactamase superfamily)
VGKLTLLRCQTGIRAAFVALLLAVAPGLVAEAQENGCRFRDVNNASPLHYAATTPAPVPWGQVRLTYHGHSSFLFETPGGASVYTDFNGIHMPPYPPDIATMNNARTERTASFLDEHIRHLLRGWDPDGGMAQHDVTFKDVHVFNLPTNTIRMQGGRTNSNSIFAIESAGLCMAHLGNIQHILSDEQRRNLRGLDVLIVPVDGGANLSHAEVMLIIEQLAPRLVIPMHFQLPGPVAAFRKLAERIYSVKNHAGGPLFIGQATLQRSTEVLFMAP